MVRSMKERISSLREIAAIAEASVMSWISGLKGRWK